MADFFNQVRECFVHDDGSLPGIEIAALQGDDVARIYRWIRQRSRLQDPDVQFFHRVEDRSVKLDDYPQAPDLVVFGDAEAFNFTAEGLTVDGIELPPIGVFVFNDEVELYYRMGPMWNAQNTWAFFRVLKAVMALAPTAELRQAVEGPPDPDAFSEAWRDFTGTAAE